MAPSEYLRTRLGIGTAAEISLPSEFDFTRQAVLYLPARMPDPRSADFSMAAGRQVIEILRRTRGRAFVLFTSYATLRDVQAVTEMALDFPILVQGTAPRTQLLKQFRATPHAVLFATSSFWQGVDVVGDRSSCVIVDKLPFASPAIRSPAHGSMPSARAAADHSTNIRCRSPSWPCSRGSAGSFVIGRSGRAGGPRPAAAHQGLRPAVHRLAATRAGRA